MQNKFSGLKIKLGWEYILDIANSAARIIDEILTSQNII
jgi:hypothetical protein